VEALERSLRRNISSLPMIYFSLSITFQNFSLAPPGLADGVAGEIFVIDRTLPILRTDYIYNSYCIQGRKSIS
jgi:hypothetical protein